MNDKFLNQITEFIFVEDKPEKSDVIFIPEAGFRSWQRKRQNYIIKD